MSGTFPTLSRSQSGDYNAQFARLNAQISYAVSVGTINIRADRADIGYDAGQENLYALSLASLAIEEQEQIPRERLDLEVLGNNPGQTIEALSHIGRFGEDEDAGSRGDRDHDASVSDVAWTTTAMIFRNEASQIRVLSLRVAPPGSTKSRSPSLYPDSSTGTKAGRWQASACVSFVFHRWKLATETFSAWQNALTVRELARYRRCRSAQT